MKRQILLVIVLALATAACDRVQLLAPTDSELTLTAAATFLPPSGTTTVSAFVIESAGTPVQNGTTVRFTTTLGRVEPAQVQTSNGLATTTFFADGASGEATIRATSGTATSDEAIVIAVGTNAIAGVSIRANPSSLPSTGGSVAVTARVTGAEGQGLSGIPVTFTTSAGTLSSTTATTDANGDATVQLSTTRAATVTAHAGAEEAASVEIEPLAAATVTLSTPTSVAAGTPVSLTVTPTEGTAPRVTVNWGDGASTDLGTLSSPTTIAHVYTAPGPYTISATATDDGTSNTTSTTVSITAPTGLSVAATDTTPGSNTNVVFTITPSTAAGVQNVRVDFGDGDVRNLGAIATATNIVKSFASNGTYVVRATQTTTTGTEIVFELVVTVS